jgi:hypothetical protein
MAQAVVSWGIQGTAISRRPRLAEHSRTCSGIGIFLQKRWLADLRNEQERSGYSRSGTGIVAMVRFDPREPAHIHLCSSQGNETFASSVMIRLPGHLRAKTATSQASCEGASRQGCRDGGRESRPAPRPHPVSPGRRREAVWAAAL